jgi:hypothetical protein
VVTLITSPLIHVQEEERRILAFVAPDNPRVKDAMPPMVDTVVEPKRVTAVGAPVKPLIDERMLTVQDTDVDVVNTCLVAPFINCITKG